MAAPLLHITVTALSMVGDFNDISHEVKLVKAALLYADHVTLASPKATSRHTFHTYARARARGC